MLKDFFRKIFLFLSSFFSSLDNVAKKELFFFFLYFLLSFLFIFLRWPLLIGIFLLILAVFFWKVTVGLSWLNLIYLILGAIEAKILFFWLKPFWLLIFFLGLVYLFFLKIPMNKKSANQIISVYLLAGWIVISYGLYFYLNYYFILSFLFYLVGLAVFSYFNFLSGDKFVPLNYLAFLLVNLEVYWLLSYLSLGVLQIAALSVFGYYFFYSFF